MRYLIAFILSAGLAFTAIAQTKSQYASSTFCLPVSDLDKSSAWYQELLGQVESFSPAPGVIEFMLNENTWLQLFEGAQNSNAILRLEVADIEETHERLTDLGLNPTAIELVPGVVSYFDFKDPDGNQLSFYKMETQ